MLRYAILISIVALLVAACTSEGGTPSSPAASTPSTSTTAITVPRDPILATIDELIEVTEDLRGLDFLAPPQVTLVSEEELADRVRLLIEDELDPEETRRDELLLSTLGLIADEVDMRELYLDLYSEQVAGYYDGETAELVVPVGDGELSELQRLTLVHELTHALTDQYFEFADRLVDLDDAQRFEEATALSGLVEGDATLTETLYLGSQSQSVQFEVLEQSMEIETDVFDRTPRFIQELLLFPYTTGFDFATAVWDSGGFAAIDLLYSSVPTTTEHIYHPADFMAGEAPVVVNGGGLVPDGYVVAEESVWGQAAFRAMFGQALDDGVATAAAVGWGGDTYQLLWNGDSEIVFDLVYVADSTIDANEMFATLSTFVRLQIDGDPVSDDEAYVEVEGEDFAMVFSDEQTIRFVVATDPVVGNQFAEELRP